MDHANFYKVVLVFYLTSDSADEELKRSKEVNTFPNRLAKEPGFIELELVKISNEKTMSIQTWATEAHWWAALEKVKNSPASAAGEAPRENILLSRDFLSGYVQVHKSVN